jgi:DNA replication and repair protein RecF
VEIIPSADANLFSGYNGQGKTNLLESIYLLGYGKSFRTANPKDCIQHGQSECRVEGTIEHGTLSRNLQVIITNTEKKLFLLGKHVPLDEFVGKLHVLAFTREHLNVVRGSPADRRAFLDRAMVTLYPGHVHDLAIYGRSLKHRNRILSSTLEKGNAIDENLMDTWDEAIIKPGARILSNRMRYVEQMKQELPQGLFGAETLKMHYVSSITADLLEVPAIEECFRQRLRQARTSDKRTGYTSVGPHRDDLKLFVNGKSLVDFGSSGQQRSCLLSLYFSQMEIHHKVHGFYPVFLVDDAEAELDTLRIDAFLQFLSQRTQTFLTSAKEFLLSSAPENTTHFEVQNGEIFPVSDGR